MCTVKQFIYVIYSSSFRSAKSFYSSFPGYIDHLGRFVLDLNGSYRECKKETLLEFKLSIREYDKCIANIQEASTKALCKCSFINNTNSDYFGNRKYRI